MTPDQDEAWHEMVELGQEIGDEPSPALVAEVRKGLAAVDRGETADLGSFAQYFDSDDEMPEPSPRPELFSGHPVRRVRRRH